MHSVKYCNAKFAHQGYKDTDEYRSPSLVALNANCNRKRFAKMRQRKSAFKFDLQEQELERMPLLVHVFVGLSFLQHMIRSCFMSGFKFTPVLVDGALILSLTPCALIIFTY